MDSKVSVSKGCFAYKPQSRNKCKAKKHISPDIDRQPWYNAYRKLWGAVEQNLEVLREEMFSDVLENLILYIRNCHSDKSSGIIGNEIPSATLLTGVNLPDHDALFSTLASQLQDKVTPYVATLQNRSCASIRSTIEHMILQFMNYEHPNDDDDHDTEDATPHKIKKSQCNFLTLSAWYKEQIKLRSPKKSPQKKTKDDVTHVKEPVLVVIIPNVEGFSPHILQHFILIASCHIKALPLVLVFGVATAVSSLHRSLPYHVSSKLCNSVFHSQPSTSYLNLVVEKVFLTSTCPFHLDEKTFKLLTDVFLFYNFSVHGFIQGFKYCMMEHFYDSSYKVLCCPLSELSHNVASLKGDQLEELRQLPSFHRYLETLSKKETASLLEDKCFKVVLEKLIIEFHIYLRNFHVFLKCLNILTSTLPKSPLGKHLREVYSLAVSSKMHERSEFKECFQILSFQSRDELLDKLGKVLSFLEVSASVLEADAESKNLRLKAVQRELTDYYKKIEDVHVKAAEQSVKSPSKLDIGGNINRFQLKEKLLELTRKQKPLSAYEEARKSLIDYLAGSVFPEFLVPPGNVPFNEVFFSSLTSVKRHIIGVPRAALHMALNTPQYYLQCECCKLSDPTSIIPSLPDICIVYKLHLECGRLINMYDWLQSFLAVVSPNDSDEEQREVAPEMQARFTRAVAELQFLGFIKTSKKKTDHVMRLTWGGS